MLKKNKPYTVVTCSDVFQRLGLNGCQDERFVLEPGVLQVNWDLQEINITWCPRLAPISEFTPAGHSVGDPDPEHKCVKLTLIMAANIKY